jgi:hypothetical protein
MRLNNYLTEAKVAVEVYENPDGDTATVKPAGKGYYAEIDRSYDMSFKNKKELNKWLKSGKWEYIGTDLVYESVSRGRTTENEGHSHDYRVDAIGSGFTTLDNTKHIHAIGV